MGNPHIGCALQQIETVRSECLNLLKEIKDFSPPDEKGHYPSPFRLIATPMLYSAWERCFLTCHAVALRLIRDTSTTTNSLSAPLRSIWLLKTPFYKRLVDKVRNAGPSSDEDKINRRIQKGDFNALCDFLPEFDKWLISKLDYALNTDELVMTFSNVNPDVVDINARSIGIDGFQKFKDLKLGRLHDLVGQRNDIGHGGIISPPSNETFKSLFEFTENLISDYCDVFIAWMQMHFAISNKRKLPKRQKRARKLTKRLSKGK